MFPKLPLETAEYDSTRDWLKRVSAIQTDLCEKKNTDRRGGLTWPRRVILVHSWKFTCYDTPCVICEGQLGYRRPRTPAGTRRKRVARRGGARPALLIASKHADRIRDSAWSPRGRQFRTFLSDTLAGPPPEWSRWSTRESRSNYRVYDNSTKKNVRIHCVNKIRDKSFERVNLVPISRKWFFWN